MPQVEGDQRIAALLRQEDPSPDGIISCLESLEAGSRVTPKQIEDLKHLLEAPQWTYVGMGRLSDALHAAIREREGEQRELLQSLRDAADTHYVNLTSLEWTLDPSSDVSPQAIVEAFYLFAFCEQSLYRGQDDPLFETLKERITSGIFDEQQLKRIRGDARQKGEELEKQAKWHRDHGCYQAADEHKIAARLDFGLAKVVEGELEKIRERADSPPTAE